MRRLSLFALLVIVLTAVAVPQQALAAPPATVTGTAWVTDPATGRTTVTADETVPAAAVARLRAGGAEVRRDPGRLRTLLATGDPAWSGGTRCTVGANVRSGTTYFFIAAGHCLQAGSNWYLQPAQTTLVGPRAGISFPGNDYGLVRYTNPAVTHPGTGKGWAQAYVGQAVCRRGATTGVRCGTVTGLNATVNYAQGSVTGLIRTNVCAEPGDSGGPLYAASNGALLGILSGGSGNCTTGGTTYYQPIGEILAAYGVSLY